MNDFWVENAEVTEENPLEKITDANEKWKKQRALVALRAIHACMECRNSASRSVDNIADQLSATVRRRVVCAVVALPRLQTFPGLQRIQIPTGRGTLIEAWVDPFTQVFSVSPGELEALATATQPELVLRWTASKLRSTATKCCEAAVKRRLWGNTNTFIRRDVEYHRTRVKN